MIEKMLTGKKWKLKEINNINKIKEVKNVYRYVMNRDKERNFGNTFVFCMGPFQLKPLFAFFASCTL